MDRTNFEFLALYTSDDNIIMAKKDETRFKDAKEFFEYAKNNIVTIGTAGARTDDAVAVAMLEKELGLNSSMCIIRIPQKDLQQSWADISMFSWVM